MRHGSYLESSSGAPEGPFMKVMVALLPELHEDLALNW